MRRYSSRLTLSTLTELNVTPLLDLAFVLLIIFMITTPLIENSLDLVVPTSSTAKSTVKPGEVMTIGIHRQEQLTLNNTPITLEDLEASLRQMHAQNPRMAVVIRCDQEIKIQKFVTLMDLLGRIGISQVGVMTHPEPNPSQIAP